MNRFALVIMGVVALVLPLTLIAQVPNEGLANGIVAARKKNATMLMNYNWNCRTEIDKNGNMQDMRVELVNLGPDGQPQRSLLNDQPGQLPGGFFRKRFAERQEKNTEKYVKDLSSLVDQYTLPSAGAVVSFLAGAQVQPVTTPQGTTVLQVNGTNVGSQGDTFAMTVNGSNLQPVSIQITTQYNGDPVNISATFKTMQSGLNHLQYATVTVPNRNINVNIHNYDYVSNN
jgi:hypothetical protein